MKKISAILLALVMILALAVTPAFAATTAVSFNTDVERDIEAYQLMTASVSGDMYAYVVNDKYSAVLIDVLGLTGTPTSAEIVSAVGSIHGADNIRHFADKLYRAIKTAGLTPETTFKTGATTSLEQGYWLFADVTDFAGQNKANSVIMVDTVGDTAVTINVKPDNIITNKKLDDENDSLVAPAVGAEDGIELWEVADYDIGDLVPYEIDIQLPNNAAAHKYYAFVIQDTASKGLTYDLSTLQIIVEGTPATIGAAGSDKDFVYETVTNSDGSSSLYVYPNFGYTRNDGTVTAQTRDNGGDILGYFAKNLITDHTVINNASITLKYKCRLNESAVTGIAGNPNKYTLKYSNNPFGDTFGETPDDTTIVLTYNLIIDKTDHHGAPLAGADFELQKFVAEYDEKSTKYATTAEWEAAGYYHHINAKAWGKWVAVDRKTIDATGTKFTFAGLDDGYYMLVETDTPEGYNGIDPIKFEIIANHVTRITSGTDVLTSLEGIGQVPGEISFTANLTQGSLSSTIENHTGSELPSTGGVGTTVFYVLGGMMLMGAVVLLITKKRMAADV